MLSHPLEVLLDLHRWDPGYQELVELANSCNLFILGEDHLISLRLLRLDDLRLATSGVLKFTLLRVASQPVISSLGRLLLHSRCHDIQQLAAVKEMVLCH